MQSLQIIYEIVIYGESWDISFVLAFSLSLFVSCL